MTLRLASGPIPTDPELFLTQYNSIFRFFGEKHGAKKQTEVCHATALANHARCVHQERVFRSDLDMLHSLGLSKDLSQQAIVSTHTYRMFPDPRVWIPDGSTGLLSSAVHHKLKDHRSPPFDTYIYALFFYLFSNFLKH